MKNRSNIVITVLSLAIVVASILWLQQNNSYEEAKRIFAEENAKLQQTAQEAAELAAMHAAQQAAEAHRLSEELRECKEGR